MSKINSSLTEWVFDLLAVLDSSNLCISKIVGNTIVLFLAHLRLGIHLVQNLPWTQWGHICYKFNFSFNTIPFHHILNRFTYIYVLFNKYSYKITIISLGTLKILQKGAVWYGSSMTTYNPTQRNTTIIELCTHINFSLQFLPGPIFCGCATCASILVFGKCYLINIVATSYKRARKSFKLSPLSPGSKIDLWWYHFHFPFPFKPAIFHNLVPSRDCRSTMLRLTMHQIILYPSSFIHEIVVRRWL